MSSYESQESEQFKLVSLDGNVTKPGAQKAKQAYSSYLKEDESGSTAPLQLSEDELESYTSSAPTQTVEKKAAPPAPKAGTKHLHMSSEPKSAPAKSNKKYNTSEDGVDLFSEKVEEVQSKIGDLKDSVATLFSNVTSTISAIFMKVGAVVIKPFILMAGIFVKVMSIPLNITNKIVTAIADKVGVKNKEAIKAQEIEDLPPPELKKSSFNEMIELNIFFTDNYKKNLYNKPKNAGFKLSKMEEELILGMAIEAIKECAEFTLELPPPTTGLYEGISISRVMEEVTPEDIAIFLGFVKAFPGKYIGKSWKVSETFATWLINNSPTG